MDLFKPLYSASVILLCTDIIPYTSNRTKKNSISAGNTAILLLPCNRSTRLPSLLPSCTLTRQVLHPTLCHSLCPSVFLSPLCLSSCLFICVCPAFFFSRLSSRSVYPSLFVSLHESIFSVSVDTTLSLSLPPNPVCLFSCVSVSVSLDTGLALPHPPLCPCWLKCCFTSTETIGLLGTGAQDDYLDFHTAPAPLCPSVCLSVCLFICCLSVSL